MGMADGRSFTQRLAALWHARLFSPKDLVRRAVVISMLFAIAHLAGLREFTSILNGTVGSVQLGWGVSAFLGLVYITIYLAFVLLMPMLLLAAGLLLLWRRLSIKERT